MNSIPEEIFIKVLSFLDVPSLVSNKAVCRSWQSRCTDTLRRKGPIPKAFETYNELCNAVKRYTKYKRADAEVIASTYGWPIDRWDVSNVQSYASSFNQDLSSWASNIRNIMENGPHA